MSSASNYTSTYAKALLAATRQGDRARSTQPSQVGEITRADLALMKREVETIKQDFKAVDAAYGEDMLHLVIATSYISKLVRNRRIERYLEDNHPEILEEFKAIIAAASVGALPGSSSSP